MEKGTNEVTRDKIIKTEDEKATFENDSQALTGNAGPAEAESSDLSAEEASHTAREEIPDGDSFMKLYEESLKSIQEGEVIKGEIVQIGKEYVLVDIGYKSEGRLIHRVDSD